MIWMIRQVELVFQSTPPARGATTPPGVHAISIHAPREGGDSCYFCTIDSPTISIHAPREGGDPPLPGDDQVGRDFNPRPPRGGRPR